MAFESSKLEKFQKANFAHFMSFPLGGNVLKDIFWKLLNSEKSSIIWALYKHKNRSIDSESHQNIAYNSTLHHWLRNIFLISFWAPYKVWKLWKSVVHVHTCAKQIQGTSLTLKLSNYIVCCCTGIDWCKTCRYPRL